MTRIVKSIPMGFFLVVVHMLAFAGPVPDTGQTKCYDDSGNEIVCPQPGEAYHGQDGSYLINPPSYTKLDSQGNDLPDSAASWTMVRDNVTSLIWEVKTNNDWISDYTNPHDADNCYTWYDPDPATNGGDAGTPGDGTDTRDFIDALNAANFGGYCDWRLPTRKELRSILHYRADGYGKNIDADYFPNTKLRWTTFLGPMVPLYYWSSTVPAEDSGSACGVNFSDGYDGVYSKSLSMSQEPMYARAVRGGQPEPSDRLLINGDGTVTDTFTGLMWQQDTAAGTYTWAQALACCEGLELAGYTDWRLPTIKELDSIVDLTRYGPSIDTSCFPDTQSSDYWSSTTRGDEYLVDQAWCMGFDHGRGQLYHKSNVSYVRAVRGGQNRLAGNLVITGPMPGSIFTEGDTLPILWDGAGLGGSVRISISTQAGREGSFLTIAESTENDGRYEWLIGDALFSSNCLLKIESLEDSGKSTTQGLFSIVRGPAVSGVAIEGPDSVEENGTGAYSLVALYEDGTSRTVTGEVIWRVDSPYANIGADGVLTAFRVASDETVTISAEYGGQSDTHTVTIRNVEGCDLTAELWAKAVLKAPGGEVELSWKMVGTDITPIGAQVISGYFYADPAEFAYGSVYNPEIFVKIYIDPNGWCNIAFSHVTVDDVEVYSAHHYAGTTDQTGTVTLNNRLAEHQYTGVSIDNTLSQAGMGAVAAGSAVDGGYPLSSELWAKAVLQVTGGPVTLIWRQVGTDTTASGDMVVSGYFYADPADFAYGSACNPEVFVKVYIAANGWANMAFNHVTVDDVSISSAHNYSGSANQTGSVTLTTRLAQQAYTNVGAAGF